MIELIEERRAEVEEICRRHGVRQLDVFGSAADGRFQEGSSDLDFLVDFEPPLLPGIADRYFGLAEDLEVLFGRHVDLVTVRSVQNPYFKESIERTRKPLFAA